MEANEDRQMKEGLPIPSTLNSPHPAGLPLGSVRTKREKLVRVSLGRQDILPNTLCGEFSCHTCSPGG